MPTQPEALRLNLEFYRKQAKALLKAAHAADPQAIQRLTPHVAEPIAAALHHAQLTIAREQGFPSWPGFRAFLAQSALDFDGIVNAFVEAAITGRHPDAAEMLAAHPSIATAGLYPALVLGLAPRVERILAESPDLLRAKGGPRSQQPLHYVCFSSFANGRSGRSAGIVETARFLLRLGADPNHTYEDQRWPGSSLSCLYGVTGLNNNPALGRVLLEAGATPNDSESLYHSTEHPDLACVKLLLEFGVTVKGTNALNHMLDREDLYGLQLLLTAGGDPNERKADQETSLHWAVWRGRSAACIAELLDHGVDIDARRHDGRTAYAMALQSGQRETVELLEARGASKSVFAIDRFVNAAANASPEQLAQLIAGTPPFPRTPENERLVPDLASARRPGAVRALLALGMPVDARGELGATALHWACWKGYPEVAQLMIDHGAPTNIEDLTFQGTPGGWLIHGLSNCGEPGADYPAVARILLTASVVIPKDDLPTGNEAVDSILREYGVLP